MPPPGNVSLPPIDPMLTTFPQCCWRIPGNTSWHIRISPNTFVSNWRRTCSTGIVSTAPDWLYPALLTSTPTAPSASVTASTAACIDASSVTSSASVRQPFSAKALSVSGRRAVA
jgi:hypothetical protein